MNNKYVLIAVVVVLLAGLAGWKWYGANEYQPIFHGGVLTSCEEGKARRPILIDGDRHCLVLDHSDVLCPVNGVLIEFADHTLACANGGKVTDLGGNPLGS